MIFDGHEEEIFFKKPFWGKLDFDLNVNWNDVMHWLDNHPEEHIESYTEKSRVYLAQFHKNETAPQFAKETVDNMRSFFEGHTITNIAFMGLGKTTKSYPWHKDKMDVFLVQVLSTITLHVEGEEERELRPGEYVWIPRGTHHEVKPQGSRVTFSFGVEGDPDPAMCV